MKQAMGLARKIASKSRVALDAAERAMKKGLTLSIVEGLAHEAELFGKVVQSRDMREGVQAFLEKRQPKFQDQ